MTTQELLKTAQNLPLHDPARMALLEALREISGLRQALQYANAALLAAQTDRATLLCACARIAYGVGTADDYSKTAKAAIAGLVDMAADWVDNATSGTNRSHCCDGCNRRGTTCPVLGVVDESAISCIHRKANNSITGAL